MTTRSLAFAARVISDSRESATQDRSGCNPRSSLGSIPSGTAEYVRSVNFSREELNAAYATARAQGNLSNAR